MNTFFPSPEFRLFKLRSVMDGYEVWLLCEHRIIMKKSDKFEPETEWYQSHGHEVVATNKEMLNNLFNN
jgi:hypothetical protein